MRKKTVASRFRKSLSCTVDGVGLRFRSVWCIHTKVSQACIYIYIHETILQLWLLLVPSFEPFFPPTKKNGHSFCGDLRMEIIMMPRYMQFSLVAGSSAFGWWGVCRSPKISYKIPWASFEQWKLVAKFIYIECRVVRKSWFWYIFTGKVTRHQPKFESLLLSWNNENFLNSLGGFVVVNWLRPRPHGDTNVVA